MSTSTYTASGIEFPYEGFTTEHISLEDIAHHLSLINRWCGGTSIPFSVLNHTLYCGEIASSTFCVGPRLFSLVLLHDAHEAYTGDIPSPMRDRVPFITDLQARLDMVIFRKFGLKIPNENERKIMHEVDMLAQVGEALAYMPEVVYRAVRQRSGAEIPMDWPCPRGITASRMEIKFQLEESLDAIRSEQVSKALNGDT